MESSTKPPHTIVFVLIVVVIIGSIIYFSSKNDVQPKPVSTPQSNIPVAIKKKDVFPASASVSAPKPAPAILSKTRTVTIQSFTFNQPTLTVKKGDVVTWTNQDAAPHTVTGDNGGLSSPTIGMNGTYSFTFTSVGTFNYHCTFHPSMKGTVVVVP